MDRVPEELLTEVCDIVRRAVIKTIPKKNKCKKAKWLSEEALQIAEKRREAKGRGDMGSILGSRRSPEEGNGNTLQFSCLGDSMDRGN